MDKKESKKLRKHLPRGYAQMVAKKLKFSIPYVYMVANGTRNNEKIMDELFKLAISYKQSQMRIKRNIKQL